MDTELIFSFLKELQANNNREWFYLHRSHYEAAKAQFYSLVDEVIARTSQSDGTLSSLTAQACVYRINRDIRFSANKSPYKCHMGAFLCAGGKKSGNIGYYFQLGADDVAGWPDGCMLAAGHYCLTSQALQSIREDIYNDGDAFEQTLRMATDFTLDSEPSLRRVPKGYSPTSPYANYLRLKNFCLTAAWKAEAYHAPNLAERIATAFQTTQPFVTFINRAIAYANSQE